MQGFLTAFEAAHLLAFGSVRDIDSYRPPSDHEIPSLGVGEIYSEIERQLGSRARDDLFEATHRLKTMAAEGRLSVFGRAPTVVNSVRRLGGGAISVRPTVRPGPPPPLTPTPIDAGYFLDINNKIDIISGTLNFPAQFSNLDQGSEFLISIHFESLTFSRSDLEQVISPTRSLPSIDRLPPDEDWHVMPHEAQNKWILRPVVRSEADRRQQGIGPAALARAYEEMARESGRDWKAASIGAAMRQSDQFKNLIRKKPKRIRVPLKP